MLIDLHAKSHHSSDVGLTVDEVLDRAVAAKLDGVAFCESLSSARCHEAIQAGSRRNLPVFVGIEIPTDKGLLMGFMPEIGSFYLEEEWRQLTALVTPAAETISAFFDERGGAVIAARPYDLDMPYNMGDRLFGLDRLHGVEVFNSRVGQIQTDFALEAARSAGLPTTGGSDPRDDADAVGALATFFPEEIDSQSALVDALREGACWGAQLGDVDRKASSRSKKSRSRKSRSRRRR